MVKNLIIMTLSACLKYFLQFCTEIFLTHIPVYWLGLLTGQALISNLCKFVIIKKVKSKMSGSMLALAVGEWLRAEGPRQSV